MMTLETQRLILREWRKTDVSDLFDIMKNSSVIMGGWEPHSNINITGDVLNEYIESDDRWAVSLKDSKKVIGCVRVYPDNNRGNFYAKSINYVLSEDYWGNGYITEAMKRIIKYLFEELDIDLLSAFHYPDNIKSKKVLEKCGFEYEITIEQGSKRFDGKVFDAVCYSILKSDYIENKLHYN
ncbi:MAG: GNAT family N-acetyltransferase [Clostridia bacterium]|nr:GNAT family N-acetyltransferase [Clostridia bacterium]